MIRRILMPLALLCSAGPAVGAPVSIYEVPEDPQKIVGAWDVNIMADDVHFEAPAVLRQVRLRLAIKGTQACTLWVFDAMSNAPIYTAAFTNVLATNEYHVSTYDFDMHLQVPRDIYIGFSAQGDGWSGNLSDYWTRGFIVNRGVAGTAGEYYYGPVAGSQLTTRFNSGDLSYACLQILSEPVQIGAVELAGEQVNLSISNLPVYATNVMERIESMAGTGWTEVDILPMGVSNHTWNATGQPAAASFYRIQSR